LVSHYIVDLSLLYSKVFLAPCGGFGLMKSHSIISKKWLLSFSLALSTFAASLPLSVAAPGDTNSINDGQVVTGGTYYNTPGEKTTFQNSGGTGLWLKSGTTVTGLEKDLIGNLTGNGGWVHFNAPGQAVRLDGNINVSAVMSGGGYAGNGGRVTVNSSYLYQNGQIYANGANGGSVQFNVGSAMFGPAAKIDVRGFGNGVDAGYGGQIGISASGIVDVGQGAIFDASGKLAGTFDTTLINIEGGVINVEGILRADGVLLDGGISDGGVIRLVASGLNTADMAVACVDCAITKSTGIFTDGEKQTILDRQNQLANANGDVVIGSTGVVSANGVDGNSTVKNASGGGTIIATAVRNIINNGLVTANGGNALNSTDAAGDGGDGGAIALLAAADFENNGVIRANGGNGGNSIIHVGTYGADNGAAIGGGEFASVSDASGFTGGNGGNGGAIAISAYSAVVNTNLIEANGGNGGKGADATANDYDPMSWEPSVKVNAYAQAEAYGGNGGDAGNGGLVVVSAPVNPTGGGTIKINAGLAGNGGNATAYSGANGTSIASSNSIAIAGNAGNSGDAGLVVVYDPGTVSGDQTIESKSDHSQQSGTADAKAWSYGPANVVATTYAETGYNGTAKSQAHAEQTNTTIKLDPTATATAISGDYGKSDASAVALGQGPTNASANAQSGNYGEALANARSNSTADIAIANAIANSLNHGYSLADARSTSGYKNSAKYGADSNALATSGNFGTSLSKATADSTIAPDANTDARATATSNSGDDSYAESNVFVKASDDSYAQTNANTGDRSVAKVKTDNTAKDSIIQTGAYALVGHNSYAYAYGTSNAGRNVNNAEVFARGLNGSVAVTENYATAVDSVVYASVESYTGNDGVSKANLVAKGGSGTNDNIKAHGLASTGNNGKAELGMNAQSGDDVEAEGTATSGVNGYSVAGVVAKSTRLTGKGDAIASATANSGTDGTSRALAQGDSATGYADVDALANLGSGGKGLAQATAIGGDAQAKIVGNGPNLQDNHTSGVGVTVVSQVNRGAANPQVVNASNPLTNAPTVPIAYQATSYNAPAQLQNNEVVIHNHAKFLLSLQNGGTINSIITDAVAHNTDRSVANLFGGAEAVSSPTDIVHLAVADSSDDTLNVDASAYSRLNSLTVLKRGDIVTAANHNIGNYYIPFGGGKLAFLSSNGKFVNNYNQMTSGLQNGGSIVVSAQGEDPTDGIFNNKLLASNGHNPWEGGSIVLTTRQTIYNYPNGVIDASGGQLGGFIQLRAGDSIFNAGKILANANGFSDSALLGGTIIVKAANLNINSNGGLYQASVTSVPGDLASVLALLSGKWFGGYVHVHGGTLAYNDQNAFLKADGGSFGGHILFTAGDKDPTNNGRAIVAPALLGWTPTITPGLSTTDGVTYVPGINTGIAESALNYGGMSTLGVLSLGRIILAGNNQVGLGPASTTVGLLSVVAGQDIGGKTAVELAACGTVPIGGGPGGGGGQDEEPENPNPNGGGTGGSGGGSSTPTTTDFNLLGLFQHQRFIPITKIPFYPYRIIINLPQLGLFFSSAYLPVTEEILVLAFEEYNRHIAAGQVDGEARKQTAFYLDQSGVTPEVAQLILSQIKDGTLTAENVVVGALEDIQAKAPAVPAEPNGELVQ